MTKKFKNRFRTSSTRLQSWDYSRKGIYFIRICTRDKKHSFGKIVSGEMALSHIGVLADVLWYEIKNHVDNVDLGGFVVMPNHVHGIIQLNGNVNTDCSDAGGDTACGVSTKRQRTTGPNRFQNQGQNTISSIIGSYKSAVTKHAGRLGYEFLWQSRFYDHIIRNDKSLQKITDYVNTNPKLWEKDRFHPAALVDSGGIV